MSIIEGDWQVKSDVLAIGVRGLVGVDGVIADVTNVGDLTAGTYQFAIQYASAIGDGYTSYYSVTNPTSIANPQLTTLDFNYAVGRAIIINIDNLDLTGYFQYYNLRRGNVRLLRQKDA